MTIKTTITRAAGRGVLLGRQYAPEILTAAGVAGFIAAGIIAAKQTLKLEVVHEEAKTHIEATKELHPGDKRALTRAYVSAVGGYAKLYGPSVTLAVGSGICVLSGQHILRQRNVAVVAAYKALEGTFHKYRERVVEELGEEKERELRLGLRAVENVDEEGVATVEYHSFPIGVSPYARIFDDQNVNFNENPDYNLLFLKAKQNYWNDYLKAKGHVFLNDVYKDLGFEDVSEGQIVGWIYGKDGIDNYIDFGIFDKENIRAGAYLDGTEGHVFLDFNVDGKMFDRI